MASNSSQENGGNNVGKIVEIRGVVIDAVFPDELPQIYSALRISADGRELIAEVQQHLGDDRVRAVAMDSTDGLARGLDVENTGKPISVPVGQPTPSAGRSTEIRRLSANSPRRSRSSRQGSRSST